MIDPRETQVGGDHYLTAEVQPTEVLLAYEKAGEARQYAFSDRLVTLVGRWPGCVDADKARHHVDLLCGLPDSAGGALAVGYHFGSIIKRALRTPAGQSPERDEIARLCVELVKGGQNETD